MAGLLDLPMLQPTAIVHTANHKHTYYICCIIS